MADTREIQVGIKNYEGKYRISNLGRAKSLERRVLHDDVTWIQPRRIMCHQCGTTSLYDCVRLYKGGVGKKFSVHRLVTQHFLLDWNPGLGVNHIGGDHGNNRADNLEMCTHRRNMKHAIAGGLRQDYSEKSVNAKLVSGQAGEIRVRCSSGQVSQSSLTEQYGIGRQTVSMIIRYKKYVRQWTRKRFGEIFIITREFIKQAPAVELEMSEGMSVVPHPNIEGADKSSNRGSRVHPRITMFLWPLTEKYVKN